MTLYIHYHSKANYPATPALFLVKIYECAPTRYTAVADFNLGGFRGFHGTPLWARTSIRSTDDRLDGTIDYTRSELASLAHSAVRAPKKRHLE